MAPNKKNEYKNSQKNKEKVLCEVSCCFYDLRLQTFRRAKSLKIRTTSNISSDKERADWFDTQMAIQGTGGANLTACCISLGTKNCINQIS